MSKSYLIEADKKVIQTTKHLVTGVNTLEEAIIALNGNSENPEIKVYRELDVEFYDSSEDTEYDDSREVTEAETQVLMEEYL